MARRSRRDFGYHFELEDFRDLLKGIENELVDVLKELKEDDPEKYEENKYDFRAFKSFVWDTFRIMTDLDDLDVLLFDERDEPVWITDELSALKAIDKYYKPLKQFLRDVIKKVERE